MNTHEILIAGFGGQGVLFMGKFVAYKGMLEGKQVSWLPSYGPEMRGGTANCSIIISDLPVGSPIVSTPDILIAMNGPSLEKYEDTVKTGGTIIYDSALITQTVKRQDVNVFPLPATKLASDNGYPTLSNMMLLGTLLEHTDAIHVEGLEEALEKVVSARKKALIGVNKEAIEAGRAYRG